MRVRRVQEIDISNLPEQLSVARKASTMSLLEICRQLKISPTYWYKLENGEASTISYDLLEKIESLLSLNLNINFSQSVTINTSVDKEKSMDLSRLKWIKVVTPGKDWPHRWALSPDEILNYVQPYILQQNGLTVVPLGFKHAGSEKLASGDSMVLTQHAKVTHIVEVLDDRPYEKNGWFYRYIKIIWWRPDINWDELPHRQDVLGFDPQIQKGIPYELTSFQDFHDRWDNQGGLDAFQAYLAEQLSP